MYILDTNICIYLIKKSSQNVVEKIKEQQPYQIKISAISVAELEYGVAKSKKIEGNRIALLKFLSSFDILPFDDTDAETFGFIRAFLEKSGTIIDPYDLQIAAQALSKNLILVSNNIREFKRVPNLKFENWI